MTSLNANSQPCANPSAGAQQACISSVTRRLRWTAIITWALNEVRARPMKRVQLIEIGAGI